ncbi:DUF222 domain-containing protein [Gordonia iterans]|uniref:DUF222 domain-containing protein n=1 Tax=Gordonia iterans TaxID=1004901 RepID=UPI001F25A928|nr:DUF222 domain-containing protein [Gordonia iterans]
MSTQRGQPQPGLDPAVLAAAAERDTRTLGQRQHDALQALCDWALALAGQPAPTRTPSQVVVTVTDEDLARQAGIGWTATGTRIPVSDLMQFAADTIPYLAVFSQATGQVLYLGRASRFATAAQRLALFASDRGCTAPGALGVDGPHLRSRRRTRRLAARRTRPPVAEQHHVPPRTPRTRPQPPDHNSRTRRPRATRRHRAPGDPGTPEDLGPPEEQDLDLDRDDDRSTPTIIVHYRPSPIRVIAPVDPPSGAEQILARLLTRAS